MSLGPGQAGLVEYRIFRPLNQHAGGERGGHQNGHARDARRPGHSRTNGGIRRSTVQVRINQDAARRPGITSADVADALNSQLAGALRSAITGLGDLSVPVIARAKGEARRNLDRLRSLTIPTTKRHAGPAIADRGA